ncbi:hypothetical protein [Enemella dayhoffiae]|nr:hypothetical protein [Enemella dayhoffiae]
MSQPRPGRRLLRAAVAVGVLLGTVVLAPRGSSLVASPAPQPAPAPAGAPAEEATTNTLGSRGPDGAEVENPTAAELSSRPSLRTTLVRDKVMSYCANGSLDDPPSRVRRVVLVIHGNDRQPCGMASSVLAGASREQRRTTLVIAPRFANLEDQVDRDKQLYWTFYGWSQGDDSVNPGTQLSSYAVLDEFARRLAPRPLVVAGFSGGGQFVNRYAAGSANEPLRFVIANPSSYLYFNRARPGTSPAELERCPGFNDYRYGLDRLNRYMSQTGAPGLSARYGRRQIVYLLGTEDRDPRSSSMDKSCGANAQGPNRLDRGKRYWAYLPTVFGEEITKRQRLHLVPGVAHDPVGMFGAIPAQQALFD